MKDEANTQDHNSPAVVINFNDEMKINLPDVTPTYLANDQVMFEEHDIQKIPSHKSYPSDPGDHHVAPQPQEKPGFEVSQPQHENVPDDADNGDIWS